MAENQSGNGFTCPFGDGKGSVTTVGPSTGKEARFVPTPQRRNDKEGPLPNNPLPSPYKKPFKLG